MQNENGCGVVLDLLLGEIINSLWVSDNQSLLVFGVGDGGFKAFEAYGDCCSESWFADILGVENLLGSIVAKVEEIPLPDYNVEDGCGRQYSDIAYGYKLYTYKGQTTIIFRNSSNGYYGGSLLVFTGKLPDNLTQITEDWRA